jgi:hypothetical protein
MGFDLSETFFLDILFNEYEITCKIDLTSKSLVNGAFANFVQY